MKNRQQVDQSLKSLDQQTRDVQQATRASAAALGIGGNAARETATSFTSLGRQIFQTQEEAKRLGGVWRSLDGRIREANGRFVKGREVVDQLGRSFQRTGRRATELERGFTRAGGGANILTRSVSSLGGVISGLGIATVVHQLGRLTIGSIQAAGSMDQLRHATTQVLGSAAEAENLASA